MKKTFYTGMIAGLAYALISLILAKFYFKAPIDLIYGLFVVVSTVLLGAIVSTSIFSATEGSYFQALRIKKSGEDGGIMEYSESKAAHIIVMVLSLVIMMIVLINGAAFYYPLYSLGAVIGLVFLFGGLKAFEGNKIGFRILFYVLCALMLIPVLFMLQTFFFSSDSGNLSRGKIRIIGLILIAVFSGLVVFYKSIDKNFKY